MSLWVLALAGGIVGLDGTSFPQIMISRPVVAGALMGWVLGVPAEGAALGAIFELFHLGILPIGASRYPEAGTAIVASVWAYAASGADPGTGFLMAIAFGLFWERLTGASVVLLRRWNSTILTLGEPRATPGSIQGRHLLALAADFGRSALVSVVGGLAGASLVAILVPYWPSDGDVAEGMLHIAGVAVAAGALTIFGGWRERWRLVLAGVSAGVLLLAVT